jgi:hypothetical protein
MIYLFLGEKKDQSQDGFGYESIRPNTGKKELRKRYADDQKVFSIGDKIVNKNSFYF